MIAVKVFPVQAELVWFDWSGLLERVFRVSGAVR